MWHPITDWKWLPDKIGLEIGGFDWTKLELLGVIVPVLENNTSKQYEQNNFAKQNVEHIGLHTVVAQLAPEYKTIIELIYLQGYTQSETAEALGIPLGTVKTRVRTALRELKRLMQ